MDLRLSRLLKNFVFVILSEAKNLMPIENAGDSPVVSLPQNDIFWVFQQPVSAFSTGK